MTFIEFLISNGVYNTWLEEREYAYETEEDYETEEELRRLSASDWLLSSFLWRLTKEGLVFWSSLNLSWHMYIAEHENDEIEFGEHPSKPNNKSEMTPSQIKPGSLLTFEDMPNALGLMIGTECFFFDSEDKAFCGSTSYLNSSDQSKMVIGSFELIISAVYEPNFPSDSNIGISLPKLLDLTEYPEYWTKVWDYRS